MLRSRIALWTTALVLIFGTACCKAALDTPSDGESTAGVAAGESEHAESGGGSGEGTAAIQSRHYKGKGRITHVLPDGKHVKILHRPIEDFMGGMEMSFELRDTTKVTEGDSIHFSLAVERDGYFYIDSLAIIH